MLKATDALGQLSETTRDVLQFGLSIELFSGKLKALMLLCLGSPIKGWKPMPLLDPAGDAPIPMLATGFILSLRLACLFPPSTQN